MCSYVCAYVCIYLITASLRWHAAGVPLSLEIVTTLTEHIANTWTGVDVKDLARS